MSSRVHAFRLFLALAASSFQTIPKTFDKEVYVNCLCQKNKKIKNGSRPVRWIVLTYNATFFGLFRIREHK